MNLRAGNDQYRHLLFSAGEVERVCDARKMSVLHQGAVKSLLGAPGSQFLPPFHVLPVFLLTLNC